jgi:hypothetical protein
MAETNDRLIESIENLTKDIRELIDAVKENNKNMKSLTGGMGAGFGKFQIGGFAGGGKEMQINMSKSIKEFVEALKGGKKEKEEQIYKLHTRGALVAGAERGGSILSQYAGAMADPFMTSSQKEQAKRGAVVGAVQTAGSAMIMSGNPVVMAIGAGINIVAGLLGKIADASTKEKRAGEEYTKGKLSSIFQHYAEAGIEIPQEVKERLAEYIKPISRRVVKAQTEATEMASYDYKPVLKTLLDSKAMDFLMKAPGSTLGGSGGR